MLNLVEESVKSAIANILDDPFVLVPFRLTDFTGVDRSDSTNYYSNCIKLKIVKKTKN